MITYQGAKIKHHRTGAGRSLSSPRVKFNIAIPNSFMDLQKKDGIQLSKGLSWFDRYLLGGTLLLAGELSPGNDRVSLFHSTQFPLSIKYKFNTTAKIMKPDFVLSSALHQSPNAISYTISHELNDLFPDKYILYSSGRPFDFDAFVDAGLCTSQSHPGVLEHITTFWKSTHEQRKYEIQHGWYDVTWEDHSLSIVLLTWISDACTNRYYWIVGANQTTAETFLDAVCAWSAEVRGEVLVFEDGDWEKDTELYSTIKNATFDNLVLSGRLKAAYLHLHME